MTSQDKVKDALSVWADWMRDDNTKLGFPSQSIGISSGGSVSSWEDLELSLDIGIARAVDAILEGVSNSQRLAVHHFHLAAVWRSNRTNIEDDYANALMVIEFGLRRRGLI